MFDEACFINECVRRWLWGIHLLQRLRVPPGFPRFPRMPVVMLLQLGAPTLCLRKRTPQSHLLYAGNSVCLIASYGVAAPKSGFRNNLFDERGCLLLFCSSRVETVENVIRQGQVETNQTLAHLVRRTGA